MDVHIVDSRTNQVVKRVGPFSNQTRPFAINGKETLVFVNVNTCSASRWATFRPAKSCTRFPRRLRQGEAERARHCQSRNCAHIRREKEEIWVADGPNNRAHIFDATVMPPKYKESVRLRAEPGWFTCSIDGG